MTSKARKLLEKMRQSAANWKRADLEQVYLGFGFVIRHGSKHDVVKHPDYPSLRTTLPRTTSLAKAYVREAVKLVDELEQLMGVVEEDAADE